MTDHEGAGPGCREGGGGIVAGRLGRRDFLRAGVLWAAGLSLSCQGEGKEVVAAIRRGGAVAGRAVARSRVYSKKQARLLRHLWKEVCPRGSDRAGDFLSYLERETALNGENLLFYRGLAAVERACLGEFGCRFAELPARERRGFLEELSGTGVDEFWHRFRARALGWYYGSGAGWREVRFRGPPQRGVASSATILPPLVKKDVVDVCIVGSGAGGAVVAHELCRRGVRVTLLERGRVFRRPDDYLATRKDWELEKSPLWQSASGLPVDGGGAQALDGRFRHLLPDYDDTALPTPRQRASRVHRRGAQELQRVFGFGGTTLVYEAQCTRYGDDTFGERTRDGVGHDWPLSYGELESDYDAVERMLGVSGDASMPGPPRQRGYPHPAFVLGAAAQRLERGCRKLGLHIHPQALAIASRPGSGRAACRRCGCCMLGCGYGAKSDAENTFLRPALASGRLQVQTGATCTRLAAGGRGRAAAVEYLDRAGRRHRLRARVVVLAAGAVETPRILLSSACGSWPRGAGNGSGQVGRNYQETLAAISYGLLEEPINTMPGPAVDNVVTDFLATRADAGYARGFGISCSTAGMNLLGPAAYARQVAPGWGATHRRFMKENFGHALVVQAMGEQLPDERNRLEIVPGRKDCHGTPAVRIVNRLGENDLRMLEAMIANLGELLEASGARRIRHVNSSYVSRLGIEPRGTCRMGEREEDSVVNAFCRSHEIENLYLADASVLVGGMHGNIALTIQALARRAAGNIAERMSAGEM